MPIVSAILPVLLATALFRHTSCASYVDSYVNVVGSTIIQSGTSIEAWADSLDGTKVLELVLSLQEGEPYQCWLQVAATTPTASNQSEGDAWACMAPGAEAGGGCLVTWRSPCILSGFNCTAQVDPDSGDLQLLDDRSVRWSAGTSGRGACSAAVKDDGEFVLLDAWGVAVWSSQSLPSSPYCSTTLSSSSPSDLDFSYSNSYPLISPPFFGLSMLIPLFVKCSSLDSLLQGPY